MNKSVYVFGGGVISADPRAKDKKILGGKGANLAEMADTEAGRRAALGKLLPHAEHDFSELADATGIGLDRLKRRAEELQEFNPMLGHRSCRLGITFPEIYKMQARAIFEAACDVAAARGQAIVPEVMVPLAVTMPGGSCRSMSTRASSHATPSSAAITSPPRPIARLSQGSQRRI